MLFPAVHSLGRRNSHCRAAAVPAPAAYCISQDQERQHQPCCCPWAVNTFPKPFQPSRAGAAALEGSQPMSSPSWVVSSLLAGAPSCPCTHANTPQATAELKFQRAKHPSGVISSQNLCCVTVGASAPWAGFAFRHDFQDYCFQLSQVHRCISHQGWLLFAARL